jgi:hypothetical protein
VNNASSWLNISLLRYGDSIVLNNVPYTVLHADPANSQVVVDPPASSTLSNQVVEVILRPGNSSEVVNADFLDNIPNEVLELSAVLTQNAIDLGEGLVTNTGSPDVQSNGTIDFVDMNVLPGDYLLVWDGADAARDIGHGAGVFPIQQVLSTNLLRLVDNMTAVNAAPGIRFGIQRKRANENGTHIDIPSGAL